MQREYTTLLSSLYKKFLSLFLSTSSTGLYQCWFRFVKQLRTANLVTSISHMRYRSKNDMRCFIMLRITTCHR